MERKEEQLTEALLCHSCGDYRCMLGDVVWMDVCGHTVRVAVDNLLIGLEWRLRVD